MGKELRVAISDRIGTTAAQQSITATALGSADYFENTGYEVMLLKNTGSGGTVYAHIIQRVDNELPEPKSADVANSGTFIFGPFPREIYGNPVYVWGGDDTNTADIVRVGG